MHRYGAMMMHNREGIMKAITLRNLPAEIQKIVRKEADRQRTSINKAVISLLERRIETHKKKKPGIKESSLRLERYFFPIATRSRSRSTTFPFIPYPQLGLF
jgi:hypothetical protein